jgi:hypothetical protein
MSNVSDRADANWAMPKPMLAQSVVWYPGGVSKGEGAMPTPALVSAVHDRSVTLCILSPNSYNMNVRAGVRHVGDTMARDIEKAEVGSWDFNERDKRINKLLWDGDVERRAQRDKIDGLEHDNKVMQDQLADLVKQVTELTSQAGITLAQRPQKSESKK